MTTMKRSLEKSGALGAGFLVILGALTAFDSMSIDMYLPAFSAIGANLGLELGTLQMSLSLFLLGLAVGQAVSGPLVDSYGRKTPLLVGIALFGAASAMVAMATGSWTLLAGRFLQGLGGATGLVIPRAIVGDIFKEGEATKIFTLLIQIQSICPIVAPVLGGVLLDAWGWRSVFWIVVVFVVLALAATVWRVPETHPPERRIAMTFTNVVSSYGSLFGNRRYLGMTFSMGFVMATLFGYISGSSYVFMTYYGLSARTYSIIFAAVSVGMILAGQLNFVMVKRMGLRRFLGLGFAIHLFFIVAFAVAVFLGGATVWTAIVLLFLALSTLGFLFGGLTSESMFSASDEVMGTASALLGVVQYACGAAAGMVLSLFASGGLVPYACLLFVCSALAYACWRVSVDLPGARDA